MESDAPGLRLDAAPGSLVLPGERLATLQDTPNQPRAVVRIGAGVLQQDAQLHSSKCGTLRHDARRNKVWVEGNQRRYTPALEDMVVGVVAERHADEYRLDINGTDTATLGALAFEGATKKHRPALAVGAVVYARVTRASRSMEAEASCVEPGSAKTWSGGEALYGELVGGNVVRVSQRLARALLRRDGLLARLGARVPFESAVGVNGRVWLRAKDTRLTAALSVAVQRADEMTAPEWHALVEDVLGGLGG